MNHEIPDYRHLLKSALSERLSHNSQYSLRAFARDLGLSSAQVSHVLNGRKSLSAGSARSIAQKLGWNEKESDYFCTLVQAQSARSQAAQAAAIEKLKLMKRDQADDRESRVELQLDIFRVVSDWYHFPLLELLKIKPDARPQYFAKKLGLQEIEIKLALGRLERIGLVQKSAKGYTPNQDFVISKDHVPGDAIKKFHAQILEKARTALHSQAIDERYFRTIALPFSKTRMKEAQNDIAEFSEKFIKKYSNAKDAEDVYVIANQFYRITEKDSKK